MIETKEDKEGFGAIQSRAEKLGVLDINLSGADSADSLECCKRTLDIIEKNKARFDLNAGEAGGLAMEQNTNIPVSADRKHFVGIGKMIFDSNAEWNMPHLHFMVDKTVEGNYEATLLEFGLVSWSETENGSIKSLIQQTHFYILSAMEKSGFDQFIQEANDQVMDGYWKHYRRIEFTLACSGRDLSHEMNSQGWYGL